MRDPFEARMRSFVVELVSDPPEAPPFPLSETVVVRADRSFRRNPMTDTDTDTQRRQPEGSPWRRGPAIAIAVFAVIVAVAGGTFIVTSLTGDEEQAADTPPPVSDTLTIDITLGAAAAVGTTGEVVGGLAGSLPNTIEFGEDGTYRVTDQGVVVDTGDYTADGNIITFESAPTDEVMWVRNDTFLRVAHSCDGVVGEYTATLSEPNLLTIDVVFDECLPRTTVANGLQMELVTS